MDFSGPVLRLIYYMTGSGNYTLPDVVISFFAVFVIILLVFPVHECAHGFVAKLLGDDTAEKQGRLTLNPLAHIDPMGAFMMMLFPIGYAKPVPVNPSRCNKVSPKNAMAITAAAGPVSNILMAYIFVIIYKIVSYSIPLDVYLESGAMQYLPLAFYYIASINLYLAIFNLIPVPPLDGSKILFFFLKPKWIYKVMQYQQMISIVFMMLLFLTPVLRTLISFISNYIMKGLDFLSGFIELIMK